MTHVPHDLAAEFPGDAEVIHALKQANAHFHTLAARYHETNREIHRIETSGEPASDVRLEDLKKLRLAMLDEATAAIAQARHAAA